MFLLNFLNILLKQYLLTKEPLSPHNDHPVCSHVAPPTNQNDIRRTQNSQGGASYTRPIRSSHTSAARLFIKYTLKDI